MSDESNAQSLCRSCGLCCDSTLFRKVRLNTSDNLALLQTAGISIRNDENKQFFLQPCVCYEKNICLIYRDRPHACVEFKCHLLKRYEQHDISYQEALAVIKATLDHRADVRALLQSRSSSEPTERAGALLEYASFLHRLRRYFGMPEERNES
jgi:Fe-S-cluster containining protein